MKTLAFAKIADPRFYCESFEASRARPSPEFSRFFPHPFPDASFDFPPLAIGQCSGVATYNFHRIVGLSFTEKKAFRVQESVWRTCA